MPMYIRQPIIPTAEPIRELFVVEAHWVQDRGVRVVQVDFVFDGEVAELVDGAVAHPGLKASIQAHAGGFAINADSGHHGDRGNLF